ncbi:DUF2931 family protein [Psychrobacter sp. AOP22-C1-22]|uniref:DUF2931 family protein n=1 Tax=unclassified Psychrobacter TaxID=196806 RepID=UPI00178887C3|nr:DUF2931 family protein [Psychrobacter sp. FME6]MBE0407697.1 DUF2931 family protein [Psychrobacter sp. FME6]
MKNNKVVEWGAKISNARYALYKKDNFDNMISTQKSDKIRSYSTSFYLNDGTWLRSLDGDSGIWGYGSTPLGGNPFEQPLPDKVRVTYLDNITNQYYQGEHSLPTDQIYALMTSTSKKVEDSHEKPNPKSANYYGIELAFAPDGWVIVFLTGWPRRQEVASFQATPIEPDPKTLEGSPVSSGDEMLYMSYDAYLHTKRTGKEHYATEFKNNHPEAYKKWQSGDWTISSDWYKQMQTKYPWNLYISIDGQEWNGEYYAEFANTERFAVLDDQFDKYNSALKAVPTKIRTWATDQESDERTEVEVHLYPRPQWSARSTSSESYQPYYQDPNLNYFFKYFENLYPTRSLTTNNQSASPDEFATLKINFDKNLVLTDAYLQKGNQKTPLEGAYQFSRAPIDLEEGQYTAKRGYPLFITEPNAEDLSDPAFVDID